MFLDSQDWSLSEVLVVINAAPAEASLHFVGFAGTTTKPYNLMNLLKPRHPSSVVELAVDNKDTWIAYDTRDGLGTLKNIAKKLNLSTRNITVIGNDEVAQLFLPKPRQHGIFNVGDRVIFESRVVSNIAAIYNIDFKQSNWRKRRRPSPETTAVPNKRRIVLLTDNTVIDFSKNNPRLRHWTGHSSAVLGLSEDTIVYVGETPTAAAWTDIQRAARTRICISPTPPPTTNTVVPIYAFSNLI